MTTHLDPSLCNCADTSTVRSIDCLSIRLELRIDEVNQVYEWKVDMLRGNPSMVLAALHSPQQRLALPGDLVHELERGLQLLLEEHCEPF